MQALLCGKHRWATEKMEGSGEASHGLLCPALGFLAQERPFGLGPKEGYKNDQ